MYVKNKKTNVVYTAVASSSNASSLVEPSHSDRPGYILTNDDTTIFVDTFRMYDKYTVLTDEEVESSVELLTGIVPATLSYTSSITDGATGTLITVAPTVTFNFIPTEATITVTGGSLTAADYTVTSDDEVFTITFDTDLANSTKYTISVGATQEGTSRTLATETISFTTENAAFTYTSVPADEATAIAVDATIVLTFVNATALADCTFALAQGETPVAVTPSIDETNKIVTITPDANLTNSLEYVLTITAEDEFGQTITADTISFTTVGE